MQPSPLTKAWIHEIPGANELFDWFGYWPTFHDAEIICLHLNRESESLLRVHTWEMTKEVDAKGYFINTKHVLVEFYLSDIANLELTQFNHQNVIFELALTKEQEGFRLLLEDCYGLSGWLMAKQLHINLVPGKPR